MNTFLRRCFIVLLCCLLLLMAGAITVAAYVKSQNWEDDPLSDAAQKALQYTPPTEAELRNNGYLIVAGLDAPTDGDAIANAYDWGRQRLVNAIERRTWAMAHANDDGIPPLVLPAKTSDGSPTFGCPGDGSDCFAWMDAHRSEALELLQQHPALLQRTAAAANAPSFSNPFPYDITTSTPPYWLLIRAHALLVAQAALQWQQSQTDQALATMAEAASVRERIAHSANSLLEPMLATAMQYRELRWISSAIARHPTEPQFKQIDLWLNAPMPSLQQALEGEKQSMARAFYSTRHGSAHMELSSKGDKASWKDWLLTPLIHIAYLPNTTLNDMVQRMDALAALSSTPLPELAKVYADAQDQYFEQTNCLDWPVLRNFTGKCLVTIGIPDYHTRYLQRIADVDSYRRLVILQRQAVAAHIAAADMPAWLDKSPAALRNPYTNQPMQWDVETNSLVFEGKEKQNQNPEQSSTYRIRLAPTSP